MTHGLLIYQTIVYLLLMLQHLWSTTFHLIMGIVVAVLMAYRVSTNVYYSCCSAHGLLGVYKGLVYLLQCSWPTGCLQGFSVLVAVLMTYWGVYRGLLYFLLQC